ncbi:hypothetical protein SEA_STARPLATINUM_130 [Streptomyces phage StarPlatinum]|uniref:Uncharacterized protein n=1 Tax=Streptomyces phage StarPlatinum TaxID=2283265 RepID=A0A345M8P8_9CAUD|nr:hypothetical protein HWB77_gp168 [Streptomyces phage StarPlatinum]AXH66869.1 hypothetical protein SEA_STARPLATINUM_130 [Streptomyces phage StarPlatinum]
MGRANWDVKGKYDVKYPDAKKPVTEAYHLSFEAKSKSDALSQAKNDFRANSKVNGLVYSNLRDLVATPIK